MTKRATERLFDGDGNLVVGVGQVIPEDRSDLKPLAVDPADPNYVAGHPDAAGPDPVDQPVHEPVDTVPAHTPAEQVLVDAGRMPSRDGEAVSTQSGSSKTPRKS